MGFEGIIAAAVVPAIVDMIKGAGGAVSRKWLGLSVDDQIKLDTSQVEKLKALASLDNPYGTPRQWVVDLRASFRYIAAGVVILLGAAAYFAGVQANSPEAINLGAQLIGMPFAFIFGERMLMTLKGAAK